MLNLKNKKIAVWGLGVSGLSALRLIKALDGDAFVINCGEVASWLKPSGALNFLAQNKCFSESSPGLSLILESIDLIILSPGIPRNHKLLKSLLEKGIPVWGEIELAFRYLKEMKALSPLIGITGTNGKTTTTTLLSEMLIADQKKVFTGGNIGIPFCDYAYEIFLGGNKKDYILLELSSFQLESIEEFHANIALILNLYQNHGERYQSLEEYGESKFLITKNFTNEDTLIYSEDFSLIAEWAKKQKGKKISFTTNSFEINYQLENFKLPGIHNLANLFFAVKVAEEIKLTPDAIQKTIDSFRGVPNRIEFISSTGELSHFLIYNDAKSTNWDATLTAVKAMESFNLPIHLILGGKKRGSGDSIRPYLEYLKKHVESFYLIGEAADDIYLELKNERCDVKITRTLKETIDFLKGKKKNKKEIILFSPAFPSFDQFKDYADRGEKFIKILAEK